MAPTDRWNSHRQAHKFVIKHFHLFTVLLEIFSIFQLELFHHTYTYLPSLCIVRAEYRWPACMAPTRTVDNSSACLIKYMLNSLQIYLSVLTLGKYLFHNLFNKRMVWRLVLRRPRCLSMREDFSMNVRRGVASSKGKGNLVTVFNKQQFQCVAKVEEAKIPQFICDHNATDPGGPSPRQYLLGALASCTAMTVRTFIQNSAKTSPSTW